MKIPVSAGACLTCKTEIWMEQAVYETYLQTCTNFHCVHGHTQHFVRGKSDAQKLREQLDEERRKRQRVEQDNAYQRDQRRAAEERAQHERHRANGYKGHATRITKRAKAGVCPCCNRTFQQLARHMQTQHPTFTPMTLEVIDGGKATAA